MYEPCEPPLSRRYELTGSSPADQGIDSVHRLFLRQSLFDVPLHQRFLEARY